MKFNVSPGEIKAFLVLLVLMIIVGFINGVPFIFGDAYGYYHVGKTIVTQANYPTSVEPEYYDYTGHAVINSTGKYITPYSVGQSILYFPFLAVSSLVSKGSVYTDYYKAFNGHSFADGLAILVAGVFYAYLGIIFCYLFLKQLGFSRKVSFYSTLAMYIALYILSYTFEQSGYSHVYEFFAYSAFLYTFVRFFFTKNSKFLYIASLFAGLLVLIRIVDAALIIPPFLFVLYKIRSKKVLLTTGFVLSLFAIIFFVYNYISYGSPFTLGYTAGGKSGIELGFNLPNLLFSDTRGLFVWSPVVLLSIVGLALYLRKSRMGLIFFALPILLIIAIYNFWGNWWGGVSTGQRFFIVLAPVFALGIAYFYTEFRFKFITKFLVFTLVSFSFVSSILYRLTPVLKIYSEFRNEEAALTTPASEDYRLTDMYRYQARLINNSKGISNYLNNLQESFNGGRSLLLLSLGFTDPLVRIDAITDLSYKLYYIPNNVNKDLNVNLFITISYRNLSRSFLIPNQNFKNSSNAQINCDSTLNCNISKGELLPALANRSKTMFASYSDNTKLSIYGENLKVNFVNLKIK